MHTEYTKVGLDLVVFFLNIILFIWQLRVCLSYMQGLLAAACELLVVACAIYFPDLGSNQWPLH